MLGLNLVESRPVLAQQRALAGTLLRVAEIERQAMGGGEQQSGRLGGLQRRKQIGLGRILAEENLLTVTDKLVDRLALVLIGGDAVGERIDQECRAELGGGVGAVARAPIRDLFGVGD